MKIWGLHLWTKETLLKSISGVAESFQSLFDPLLSLWVIVLGSEDRSWMKFRSYGQVAYGCLWAHRCWVAVLQSELSNEWWTDSTFSRPARTRKWLQEGPSSKSVIIWYWTGTGEYLYALFAHPNAGSIGLIQRHLGSPIWPEVQDVWLEHCYPHIAYIYIYVCIYIYICILYTSYTIKRLQHSSAVAPQLLWLLKLRQTRFPEPFVCPALSLPALPAAKSSKI